MPWAHTVSVKFKHWREQPDANSEWRLALFLPRRRSKMVTETRTRITKDMLEEYLPYRLRYAPEKDSTGYLQEVYHTYLETPSQSKTHQEFKFARSPPRT